MKKIVFQQRVPRTYSLFCKDAHVNLERNTGKVENDISRTINGTETYNTPFWRSLQALLNEHHERYSTAAILPPNDLNYKWDPRSEITARSKSRKSRKFRTLRKALPYHPGSDRYKYIRCSQGIRANFVSPNQIQIQIRLVLLARPDTRDD